MNYSSDSKFRTIPGALASICSSFIVISFFCVQLLTLLNYDNPDINYQSVLEDRSLMQEPLNLAEHNLSLYFMFMENSSSLPVVIDPRIGQFQLSLNKHSLSNEEGKTKVEVVPIQVPIKEVDLTSDIKARNLWHHLSPEQPR